MQNESIASARGAGTIGIGRYVIACPDKAVPSGAAFWSDGDGWTTLKSATRYSEIGQFTTGLPQGSPTVWVEDDEVAALLQEPAPGACAGFSTVVGDMSSTAEPFFTWRAADALQTIEDARISMASPSATHVRYAIEAHAVGSPGGDLSEEFQLAIFRPRWRRNQEAHACIMHHCADGTERRSALVDFRDLLTALNVGNGFRFRSDWSHDVRIAIATAAARLAARA